MHTYRQITIVNPVIIEVPDQLVVFDASGDPGRTRECAVQFIAEKGAGVLCCSTVYSGIRAAAENKCPVIVLWQGAGKAMLSKIKLKTEGRTEQPGNTASVSQPAPPPVVEPTPEPPPSAPPPASTPNITPEPELETVVPVTPVEAAPEVVPAFEPPPVVTPPPQAGD